MSLRIKAIIPIFVILVAIFLRFYRFGEYVTFLGDQGRDAIIIKRIVNLEHFPAIGAPSSLGQIFLGPFFYYLVAPFLLLTWFNPIGPALGVALLSLVGIILAYQSVKKETDSNTSVLFLVFALFSSVNIISSRFSWNPNLLPLFAFFTIYFFYLTLKSKNYLNALLFGAFLSLSVQLHHLAFLLVPGFILVYFITKQTTKQFFNLVISFISFLFFYFPLIVFDLRHDFLNSKNLLKFFTEGNPTDRTGFITRFLDTIATFYSHIFQLNFNPLLAFCLTAFLLFFTLKKLKVKLNLFILVNFVSLLIYLIAFTFFKTNRIPHYYNSIYLSAFVLLAWTTNNLTKNKSMRVILSAIVIVFYLFFNLKSQSYVFINRGNNQVKNAEIIADSILAKKPQIPYQVVALPFTETDGHIRYFLEIKGKTPLPADTLSDPKELYVLCFELNCRVLGNAQWQIAAFKNAKIESAWSIQDIRIYKVVHSN